jgi:hypothetical protein
VTLVNRFTVLYGLLEPQTSSPFSAIADGRLSVVLTVVDGGEALRRCLQALLSQEHAPAMEILIPYDSTVAAVPSIVDEVRQKGHEIRALDLGRLETTRPPRSHAGQHELIDRRRTAGLTASRGGIVAILEDRGVPRPDWAATAIRLHSEVPHEVIGGAIENGRAGTLNWAVYFCDFGRYQRPFTAGPRRYISDVNVVYKRRALERTREIWKTRYHEPLVHWALERNGVSLFLSPDLVVDQIRDDLSLVSLLDERLAWGRLFGSLRARDSSVSKRLVLVVSSPLLPLVLFLRIVKEQLAKCTALGRLVWAIPAMVLLLTAWAIGEAAGTLTGRP